MPRKAIDLTGKTFGELTVLRRSQNKTKEGALLWLCQCSCGTVKEVRGKLLLSGGSKTCGRCKSVTSPLFVRTHKNRLYHTWSEMHRRCDGKSTNASYYFGKGISCCPDWDDFDAFASWAINNGYKIGLEIDRIDNAKGYSPENCRWVDHKTNTRNRVARSNNNTGFAGVHIRKNKSGIVYRATIKTDEGNVNLGTFYTLEDAVAARKEAELKYWGFNIIE